MGPCDTFTTQLQREADETHQFADMLSFEMLAPPYQIVPTTYCRVRYTVFFWFDIFSRALTFLVPYPRIKLISAYWVLFAELKKFLKKHCEDETLAIADPKLGNIVKEKLGIPCVHR